MSDAVYGLRVSFFFVFFATSGSFNLTGGLIPRREPPPSYWNQSTLLIAVPRQRKASFWADSITTLDARQGATP
jgi:hypothetical protein